jgi:hypothetical protein
VKGSHTGERLARHLKEVLDRFGLDDGRLLAITTDNASSNYSMTKALQDTLETEGVEWSALRNHIPCMAHVIQLCVSGFMAKLGVRGREKSWEAHERDEQFQQEGGKKVSHARVRRVTDMAPGLHKIIEKVYENF